MRNFVQPGEAIPLALPYAVSAGQGVQVESLFGIASTAGAQGEIVNLAIEGVFDLPKASGVTWPVGTRLCWQPESQSVVGESPGLAPIGVLVAPPDIAGTTCRVLLVTNPYAVPSRPPMFFHAATDLLESFAGDLAFGPGGLLLSNAPAYGGWLLPPGSITEVAVQLTEPPGSGESVRVEAQINGSPVLVAELTNGIRELNAFGTGLVPAGAPLVIAALYSGGATHAGLIARVTFVPA